MNELKELYDLLDSIDWKRPSRNTPEQISTIDALIEKTGFDGMTLKLQFTNHHFAGQPKPIRPE